MPPELVDEGGFAPALKKNSEALDLIVEAIKKAGYKPHDRWPLPWTRLPAAFTKTVYII